jgi:hypothetical protein
MKLTSLPVVATTFALLLVSLVANVYLLESKPTPTRIVRAEPTHESDEPRDPSCAANLAACWQALSSVARPLENPTSPMKVVPPGAPPPDPPKSVDRRESLCRVAREKLREQWLEKRAALSLAAAHDLPDAVKQKADAERDAERAADALGLKGAGRRGFEDDFVELRRQRMVDMAEASQKNPIDWSRLLSDTQSLFQGEDALVQRELGDEAAASYKGTATDGRLTILSILATYADVDMAE